MPRNEKMFVCEDVKYHNVSACSNAPIKSGRHGCFTYISLSVNAHPGKEEVRAAAVGTCHSCERPGLSSRLLYSASPTPGCCRHMGVNQK